MKAILEFNLPEEREEFEHAQRGIEYLIVLQEFDNYLRGRLKYEELPDDVHKALQEARDRLYEELGARNTTLWS